MPRVAVFAPNPLLTVVVERQGARAAGEVHLHPGGQGVWVSRMAAALGATPTLCGFCGGESGAVITGLLAGTPIECRLVAAAGATGCYVMDRRDGARRLVALAESPPASRHELGS